MAFLSLLKTETDIRRLEKSGRLLRRGFSGPVQQVAAFDLGDSLKYARPEDVAEMGFDTIDLAWTAAGEGLSAYTDKLELLGNPPFWFIACDDWPASAFLGWAGLAAWANTKTGGERPLMVAAFSADQLIVGFADSSEFHDRLTHAREAPQEQPLLPLPFLLRRNAPPLPIAKIELVAGDAAYLSLDEPEAAPIKLSLID